MAKAAQIAPGAVLRGLAATGAKVAGGVVAPASMAYGANNIVGKAMNKSMLGNLQPVVGDQPKNLSEAIALGVNQPSTEAMATETRYDDVSHRIQSLLRGYNPDDPKVVGDLTKLLNERNLLWSMISSGKYGEDFASRNQ